MFLDFRPNPTPGTPSDRRGPARTSISTKNQPRRPILRPFRATQKTRQTAFRYPICGRVPPCMNGASPCMSFVCVVLFFAGFPLPYLGGRGARMPARMLRQSPAGKRICGSIRALQGGALAIRSAPLKVATHRSVDPEGSSGGLLYHRRLPDGSLISRWGFSDLMENMSF